MNPEIYFDKKKLSMYTLNTTTTSSVIIVFSNVAMRCTKCRNLLFDLLQYLPLNYTTNVPTDNNLELGNH